MLAPEIPAAPGTLDGIPPLDYAALVHVLHAAQEPAAEQRGPAERMLRSWEPIGQFPHALLGVVADESVQQGSRMLAAVCLKNCLAKFWRRKLGAGGLDEQDKARLREQLINNLSIAHANTAKQMAVAIAKIARTDWPDEWPGLLPHLLRAVQEGNGLPRMRALMYLHVAIKELTGKVVGPTRRHLAEAAPTMFEFLFGLWKEASAHALTDLAAAEVERYCSKILRRLVCHAFPRIDLNREVSSFLEAALKVVQERTYSKDCMQSDPEDNSPVSMACGTAVKLSLMFNEVQHAQARTF
jgi:hypothetical protein